MVNQNSSSQELNQASVTLPKELPTKKDYIKSVLLLVVFGVINILFVSPTGFIDPFRAVFFYLFAPVSLIFTVIALYNVLPFVVSFIYITFSFFFLKKNPNRKLLGMLAISLTLLGSALDTINERAGYTLYAFVSNTDNYLSSPSWTPNFFSSYLQILIASTIGYLFYGIILIRKNKGRLERSHLVILAAMLIVAIPLHIRGIYKVYSYQSDLEYSERVVAEITSDVDKKINKDTLIDKCHSVEFGLKRTKCFMELANATDDIEICRNIRSNEEARWSLSLQQCIQPLIPELEDAKFCTSLANSYDRDFCLQEMSKTFPESSADTDNCELLKSGKDRCYSELASRLKDKEICQQVSDIPIDWSKVKHIVSNKMESRRAYCEFNVDLQLAIDEDNWEFCTERKELTQWFSGDRANCYTRFVDGPEDKVICDNMKTGRFEGSDRGFCYFRLARMTDDFSLCQHITTDWIKKDCETNNKNTEISNVDRYELEFFD